MDYMCEHYYKLTKLQTTVLSIDDATHRCCLFYTKKPRSLSRLVFVTFYNGSYALIDKSRRLALSLSFILNHTGTLKMAIASAQQRGSNVLVYGERGQILFTRAGTLQGYTSSTVTIINALRTLVITYNDKGTILFTREAR